MTKTEAQIAAHEKYLVDAYGPIVAAAGLPAEEMEPMALLIVAGSIQNDPEVERRSARFQRRPSVAFPAIVETDFIATLESMSPAALSSLADRVRAKHSWRKK